MKKEDALNILIKDSDTNLISDIEVGRDIPEYEGRYQASTFGRIKSLSKKVGRPDSKNKLINRRRDIIMCSKLNLNNKKSYHRVNLGRDNTFLVHRLVAQTFIPNPENKPCINHLDGNKNNNHINNLEWCTYYENNQHAYRLGLNKLQNLIYGKRKRNY
mgnify:CR=1 FL=1